MYFLLFCLIKNTAVIIVADSAIGTASQTPVTPIAFGSRSKSRVIKPNVRRNDRKADIFPFESAVNAEEAKRLNPQNRKLKENMKKPSLAMS